MRLSTSNSASLYYFAVEAYAFDIAVPGEGCVGKAKEEHDHDHADDASTTASETATATATSAATSAAEVTSAAATTTETAPEATSVAAEAPAEPQGDCHTHDDGVVHCT